MRIAKKAIIRLPLKGCDAPCNIDLSKFLPRQASCHLGRVRVNIKKDSLEKPRESKRGIFNKEENII